MLFSICKLFGILNVFTGNVHFSMIVFAQMKYLLNVYILLVLFVIIKMMVDGLSFIKNVLCHQKVLLVNVK